MPSNRERHPVPLQTPQSFAVGMTFSEASRRKKAAAKVDGVDFRIDEDLQENILVKGNRVAGVTTVHNKDAFDVFNQIYYHPIKSGSKLSKIISRIKDIVGIT